MKYLSSNSLCESVGSWYTCRPRFSHVKSEGSDLDVPFCWRILWSLPRYVCFFVFCPVEGGVCSQTNSPLGSSSKLEYCEDTWSVWWKGCKSGQDNKWECLETVVEEFKWLCCLELAQDIKGIPGKHHQGLKKFFFSLALHQEEWKAEKLQVCCFCCSVILCN